MDVTQLPLDSTATHSAAGLGSPLPASPSSPALPISSSVQEDMALPVSAALADHVDIQPLDLAGALQILMSEIRIEWALPSIPIPGNFAAAPQTLVHLFLQVVPEVPAQPATWLTWVERMEGGLALALNRGIDAIAAWRDVPPAVLEDAQRVRTLVLGAVSDDPPNPLWLRPEWMGLAPLMRRFWRRRRYARRRLTDPDLPAHDRNEHLDDESPSAG